MSPLFFIFAAVCVFEISAKNHTGDHPFLIQHLLKGHDMKNTIPLGPNGEPVDVEFSIYLINVADADPKKKEVAVDAWVSLKWESSLKWSPEDFKGVESLAIPSQDIWIPDISLFNGVGKISTDSPDMAGLKHVGEAVWIPKTRLRGLCDIDAHKLASGVTCDFTFGLWANNDNLANITEAKTGTILRKYYFSGSRYELMEVSSKRSTNEYECCPGVPFSNIKISFTFKEKNPSPMMGFVQGMFSNFH